MRRLMESWRPLKIEQNVNLTKFNTFAVAASAEYFCRVASEDDILEARAFANDKGLQISILGGGSNVVLKSDLPGLCLHVAIEGRDFSGSLVSVSAGENWHDVVLASLAAKRFGLENLALIPGQVGAAPIQNIGAYGVEIAEYLAVVKGIELRSGQPFQFSAEECGFGYRDSVFKRAQSDQFLITSVELDLPSSFTPRLSYQGIREQLTETGEGLTAEEVCQVVIRLRQSKLPDPKLVGNAGSFFKNPIVSNEQYQLLQQRFPGLTGHLQEDGYKVSAGFLIEQCGLKGRSVGGAKVSTKHALVIENAHSATGEDVVGLAGVVQSSVAAEFDITLEIEPRVIPS